MEQCIAFFQEKNYTKNRIGVYKTLWKSGIVPFMGGTRPQSVQPKHWSYVH